MDKCCHISVVVKYISKMSTVMNSWDVKLKVRVPFLKKFRKEHCIGHERPRAVGLPGGAEEIIELLSRNKRM